MTKIIPASEVAGIQKAKKDKYYQIDRPKFMEKWISEFNMNVQISHWGSRYVRIPDTCNTEETVELCKLIEEAGYHVRSKYGYMINYAYFTKPKNWLDKFLNYSD